MKILTPYFALVFLVAYVTNSGRSQDLSNLTAAAIYSLINTPNDYTGQNDPVELNNTPYMGDDGVYSNGIALGNFPDGCLIRTPGLQALYDSVFAIQLQFKLTDVSDGDIHAVLVCGGSYRYIGLLLWNDGMFRILYNNQYYIDLPGIVPVVDQWYDLTLVCNTYTHQNQFYLGTNMIADFNQEFNRVPDDGQILNRHMGAIWTFKGYWRNLLVYRSGNSTAIHDPVAQSEELKIYPNPSTSMIRIDCPEIKATHWSISDLCGVNLLGGNMMDMQDELDIRVLMPGVYLLHMYDADGWPLAHKKFVKN